MNISLDTGKYEASYEVNHLKLRFYTLNEGPECKKGDVVVPCKPFMAQVTKGVALTARAFISQA